MKLSHLALVAGGLYLLSRSVSASPTSAPVSTPYMETMPTNVPAPSVLEQVLSTIQAPADLAVPKTTASGQFTGNTTGAYDIQTSVGTLHVLPYDPRQTLYDANALIKSLYNGIASTGFDKSNPLYWSYNQEWANLRTFAHAWVDEYRWNL